MDESYPVQFIEEITSHIIEGGTLPKFCLDKKHRYGSVIMWLHANPERFKKYTQALDHRNEFFVQRVIDELSAISFSDISLLYDENGNLLDPKQWPPEVSRTIQATETHEEFYKGENSGTSKRIKLWDKLRALELLGKNLAMFRDRVEHSGSLTLEELVARSYRTDDNTRLPVEETTKPPELPA